MSNTILELEQLNKSFGNLKAVDKLSLKIKRGNVYGLLGPNGSGKSTTLGMILNVINPSFGSFQWFEGQISTHQALNKIGAIIERPNFYPYMTALQNLRLICKIKKCSYETLEEKLHLVGLWDRRDSKFRTFSLGMKQRLAIAAALINNPELLVLDEPTNGLDPEGIHQIRKLIKTIAEMGTTILLASHLLDEVEKVCNQVIVLKNGVKFYEGPVDQITQTFGYFELNAIDQTALANFLKDLPQAKEVIFENKLVLLKLNTELSEEELAKKLAKAKIYPTHFVKKRPSLEQQFLTLTKTN